jgi:hypothetical protein
MRGILCAEKDVIKFSQSPKLDTEVGCSMISAKFKVTKDEKKGKKMKKMKPIFLSSEQNIFLDLSLAKRSRDIFLVIFIFSLFSSFGFTHERNH